MPPRSKDLSPSLTTDHIVSSMTVGKLIDAFQAMIDEEISVSFQIGELRLELMKRQRGEEASEFRAQLQPLQQSLPPPPNKRPCAATAAISAKPQPKCFRVTSPTTTS